MLPSLSARRAWIEIAELCKRSDVCQSLSARRAWIEIRVSCVRIPANMSLSARRAWIEIALPKVPCNLKSVALRKESVDRNNNPVKIEVVEIGSLSARRAWIEIF